MENRYEIIIFWSDEDAVFVADVPELPGCMAHGSSHAEALANAEEAIALWVWTVHSSTEGTEAAVRVNDAAPSTCGRSTEPLRTIRADVPLFAAANDIAGVLRSRLYEAAIEYDLAHYHAAARIFGEATRLAKQLRDEETVARLQNNLGHCAP